jgi:LPXTG-motif cell wall-anchored protein
MKYFYLPVTFAADYNCGAYGSGAFNNGQVCAATTNTTNTPTSGGTNTSTTSGSGGSNGNAGGSLANTGMQVILPLTLGIALITGAVVLFFRKPRKTDRA